MNTHTVINAAQAQTLADYVTGLPLPFTLTWREGARRSLDQNALLHKWYGEIAKQAGDLKANEVKAQCHVAFGVPIRRRDTAFNWVWEQSAGKLPYEKQLTLFERGVLAMTREMTKAELSEYMDTMSRHYRARGFRLTDPESAA